MASQFLTSAMHDLEKGLDLIGRHSDRPIVAIFGSARTPQDHPLSQLAEAVAADFVEQGWRILTGAGPGIMEAASRGAGQSHTLGVNIELPFEHGMNPHVHSDRSVSMRHFFTRKVVMVSQTSAFVALPGGVGTMDELFEVLTLLYTGKTDPAPVLLLEEPTGTFWRRWEDFMSDDVIGEGYLSPGDAVAYQRCNSVAEVTAAVRQFFANYVSYERVGDEARLVLRTAPNESQLASLRAFNPEARFEPADSTLRFHFEGRSYGQLRRMIDEANRWVS